MILLNNIDCNLQEHPCVYDLVIYDPPFNEWDKITKIIPANNTICFTNFQNRHHVEALFGIPKFEIIWYFKDGRWVSHNMPRLTHQSILIYGGLKNHAYVGETNTDRTPVNKGRGCVGKDKLEERIYTPRDRKMLNSVIEIPRNVGKQLGVWGKPLPLCTQLLEWLCSTGDRVFDPYAGSGSFACAAFDLGIKYIGCEIDFDTHQKAMERISKHTNAIELP